MIVALVVGALLTMPRPSAAGSMPERRSPMLVPKTNHEALRARVYDLFPRGEGRWGAVHVVDRSCSLSRGVIAHLIDRRASAEVDELVIVVARDGATTREDVELVHAGYRVRVVTSEGWKGESERGSSIATPSMIVARPDGTLAYVGGHRREMGDPGGRAARRWADDAGERFAEAVDGFVDADVIRELATSGETSASAPVIGCVSPP